MFQSVALSTGYQNRVLTFNRRVTLTSASLNRELTNSLTAGTRTGSASSADLRRR